MRAEVHKVKNVRRRIVGYRASAFGYCTQAKAESPKAAREMLDRDLNAIIDRVLISARVGFVRGIPYVLAPSIEGWDWVALYRPNEAFWQCSYPTVGDAEHAAQMHLSQMLWEPTSDPDADAEYILTLPKAIHEDMRHWIKWQRDYQTCIAAGWTDNQAHKAAGGLIPMPS